MSVTGIICEYDPLHTGHAWLMARARAAGASAVVCAMSGNFTQRGGFAAADKLARAEMAVACGADLVLELPTVWAMSTAERFARGGVEVLTRTGVVTELLFGSESGDMAALTRCADCLDSEDLTAALAAVPEDGRTFAARRQQAVEALLGPADAVLLASPNNTLAVEYLRAIRRLKSPLTARTVRRTGAQHGEAPCGGFASASYLRQLLAAGETEQAAVYMQNQLLRQSQLGKIKELFGISGRRLTPGEENYILTWLSWGFGEKEIGLAYEKTCLATGGLKWPYCNSILRSWHEQGFTTLSQIEAGDRAPAKPAAGKYSRGVQQHNDALSDLQIAAIDRMLNEKED